jgi:hypothetical protein
MADSADSMQVIFSYLESPTLRANRGALSNAAKGQIMKETSGQHNIFRTKSIPWEKDELDKFLHSPVVFSGHEFKGGKRDKHHYKQTNVLVVDLDADMTPPEAFQILTSIPNNPYFHLSYSSNHKPGEADKMHIIMPLSEPILTMADHSLLAEWVLSTFVKCDDSVRTDTARGIIRSNKAYQPQTMFGGNKPLSTLHILEAARLKVMREKMETQARDNKHLADHNNFYFTLDTPIYDGDRMEHTVEDLMNMLLSENYVNRDTQFQKIPIFCPVCGFDTQVRSEANPNLLAQNAFIRVGDNKLPYINCRSCAARGKGHDKKGSWFLDRKQQAEMVQDTQNFVVFRDRLTDRWYHGHNCDLRESYVFDPLNKEGSIRQIFWEEARVDMQDSKKLPSAVFKLDFANPLQVDMENNFVNKYTKSKPMRDTDEWLANLTSAPKTTPIPKYSRLLIKHVAGDDEEMAELFIDWLAYIYQERIKTRNAFLFQGTQGTGKDFMLNHLIAPVFGHLYVQAVNQDRLASPFNSMLESNIFLAINEVQTDFSSSENANKVAACLKMAVSDIELAVEGKGVDIRHGENNSNIICFSNKPNGVKLETGDRRFNVCPRQVLKMVHTEWFPIKAEPGEDGPDAKKFESVLHKETAQWAKHLATRKYRKNIASHVIMNVAKKMLMAITQTYTEQFIDHTQPGKINWEWLEDNVEIYPHDDDLKAQALIYQRKALPLTDEWKKYLTKSEMKLLYENVCNLGKVVIGPKFKNILTQHQLSYGKQMRINGKLERPVLPFDYHVN